MIARRHDLRVAETLRITERVRIPLADVTVRASRSSGPGGQHANVTASRIEARLDLRTCGGLSDAQRDRVVARLGPSVAAVAQEARSQHRNREVALERLAARVREAIHVDRPRTATKPTRGAKERRLAAKRLRSGHKAARRKPRLDD